MKTTMLYGPGDVRFEDYETPKIIDPTDAVIRMAVTCVCGSDGLIVVCSRVTGRGQWAMNTAALSRKSAALSNR